MKGIVIAGTHSGCGKTTVTLGIMAAVRKKGLTVQPFKAGPDFIDAGLHRLAADRPSRNLDLWMCGEDYVARCFRRHAAAADIAVVEGVMGLYDGDRSTASLAALLQAPVILVVDAYGMAESAGAVVHGFVECRGRRAESGMTFGGVLFTRVASEHHFARLKSSVHHEVPVLGYLPREADFGIPHRHLGLTTAAEAPLDAVRLDNLADAVLRHVDLDRIAEAADVPGGTGEEHESDPPPRCTSLRRSAIRIAVAYDKAFSFYYEDNLDLLRAGGAEIVWFSPLADPAIPPGSDCVYIGGGYPELHAADLARNVSMRESVRAWADAGRPLYAECGGLMYLSEGLRDFSGTLVPMAGVFPFETRMTNQPRLGYREITLQEDCLLGRRGERFRGHEFHYSEIAGDAAGSIYAMSDGRGRMLPFEGFRKKNVLASYVHVHFGSSRGADLWPGFITGENQP